MTLRPHFILFALAVLSFSSYGQECNTGTWLTPQTTNFNYNAVRFADDNIVIAAGENGTIIRSTDAGNTWKQIKSTTNNLLTGIFFINPTTGFITGDSVLLKTVDAGLTWTVSKINDKISSITFTPNGTGFITGSHGIYKSINGTSWVLKDTARSLNVSFPDNLTGYVLSASGNLLKTTDAGEHWIALDSSFYDATNVFFLNPSTGYVGFNLNPHGYSRGHIWKTMDGGTTWTQSALGNGSECIFFVDSLHGYSAGWDGSYLRSGSVDLTKEGGKNWTHNTLNDSIEWQTLPLNSIHFNSNGKGIAVGEAGAIYSADTNGTLFTHIEKPLTYGMESGPVAISSITINDDSIIVTSIFPCIRCSPTGILFKTYNKGKTWKSKTKYSVFDLFMADRLTGYATTHRGVLLKTTDGGNSWTELPPNLIFDGLGVFFQSANEGYVGGTNLIFRTKDGGSTWDTIPVQGAGGINDIYFPNQSIGYAAGDRIFKTINGGTNWNDITFSSALPGTAFTKIKFFDENEGYVLPDNNLKIYKTMDGGSTWLELIIDNPPLLEPIKDFTFINKNQGWVLYGTCLYATDDGGNSWTKIYSQHVPYLFTKFTADAEGYIYIGTNKGGVLKLNSCSMTTGITNTFTGNTFTIYPNPNTGRFALLGSHIVNSRIAVFNTFGEKVRFHEGNNISEIDLGLIPAGMYYVTIESDRGRLTKKMVIE